MPSRRLPQHPDLRHLKLQAKSLLQACLGGDPSAQLRLAQLCPTPSDATLGKAQTALAREYGVRSWPQLLHRVTALNLIYRPELETETPGSAVLSHLVEILPDHWTGANVLARAGEPAVDALIAGLKHRSARVRGACAAFFDGHRHARGIEALHQHTSDPVPRVRLKVIHSLGCERCNGKPLEDHHVKLVQNACLNDTSFKVRREATWLLGNQRNDESARQTLHTMLSRETNPELRAMARQGLSTHGRALLGSKSEEAIVALLGAPPRVAEKIEQGPPRMLYYDLAALTRLAQPHVSPPVWLRLIIKNGKVGSVTVVDEADPERRPEW